MEIIVRARISEDFPRFGADNPRFAVEVERSIRRRLQLRPQDRIVLELSKD